MHIIGAGGHAKVIADILIAAKLSITSFWDENSSAESFLGFPLSGNLESFKTLNIDQYLIAIGNNQIREKIAVQLPESQIVAVHPSSSVSPFSKIGFGTVIMPNASVNVGSELGRHVIINTNASVDHDCKIDDFVHISPQAGLAGNVKVGKGSHIGLGACVIQNVNIGKWVTIGAGTVVINDVPDYAVMVGNPGKIIKYNTQNEQ